MISPSQARQAGAVMIQVNPAFFSEIFSSLAQDQPGMAAIISADGELVASCCGTGDQEDFSGGIELLASGEIPGHWKDNLVIGTEPGGTGWSYYYIVPRKGMVTGMEYIRPIIAFLALASLIVGTGLAIAAAKKKSGPLTKTIGAIHSSGISGGLEKGERNVYAYLENAVGRLVEENQGMAADIRQQKALLWASSIQKLLDGDYGSPEELKQLMGEAHIPMEQGPFRMILLQNRPGQKMQDPGLVRVYQKNLLIETIPYEIRFFDISENRLAVLVWTEGPEGMDGLEGLLLEVVSSLQREYQIAAVAALGDSHSNPEEFSRAYRELLRLGEFFDSFPESSLITSKDLPDTCVSFYYPSQLELELMRRIQEGDEEAVQGISQALYEENMLRRRISPAMLRQLNTVVKGSLLRGLKDFLARPDAEPLSRKLYMAESMEGMTAAVLDICRFQKENLPEGKRGQQQELKQKVVAYIQSHYQDSSLSVSRAAEELGMGESALYQFFRENMTATFGEMLESVRIQAACTLLKQKKLSVKAVAEQVGYNSDTSFRRAFKRVMHVTPGEYSQ